MFNEEIALIERIRLGLFMLKPKQALVQIYTLYNEFLEKFFIDGDPNMEHFKKICCPVCSSRICKEVLVLDNISYEECDGCGVVYTPLMLKDEILMNMYEAGTYQEYFKSLVLQGAELRKNTLELRKCRQVSSFFREPGKILDVGCGSGSFLKVCYENGWSVLGIDPSSGAVKAAKEKYDINVIKGFFEDYQTDCKFECITFVGIEHLQDPIGALKKARSMLSEDGVIFYEVPSADCFLMNYIKRFPFDATRYIEAARHYLFFSRKTIEYICLKYQFELLYVETNGLDIDTILFEDLNEELTSKVLNIQETINSMELGDHYRVYLKKKGS